MKKQDFVKLAYDDLLKIRFGTSDEIAGMHQVSRILVNHTCTNEDSVLPLSEEEKETISVLTSILLSLIYGNERQYTIRSKNIAKMLVDRMIFCGITDYTLTNRNLYFFQNFVKKLSSQELPGYYKITAGKNSYYCGLKQLYFKYGIDEVKKYHPYSHKVLQNFLKKSEYYQVCVLNKLLNGLKFYV